MSAASKSSASGEDVKEKKEVKKEELTEEDLKKKEDLELMVERVKASEPEIVKNALQLLKSEIRSSTSSMTAVPKPLKFLRTHRNTLVEAHASMAAGPNKQLLADILSVLSMTVENKTRETLRYKLMGTKEAASDWGHEYLRHLAGEIAEEYNTSDGTTSLDVVMGLVDEIVPYNINHHAEPEAVDLLLEVERLPTLLQYVDETNYERIALYLTSCAHYATPPDTILATVVDVYRKVKQPTRALHVAFVLGDQDLMRQIWNDSEGDVQLRRQLAFMFARQHLFDVVDVSASEDEELGNIINNTYMSKWYQALQKDLQILDPKEPEDIYKSHLVEGRGSANRSDSAQLNLASSFVSGFVNAASGKDKLMTTDPNAWLGLNRNQGLLAAVASLGMVHMWDFDSGSTELDKYMSKDNEYQKAGGILGMGILMSGVRNDFDPVWSTVQEHVNDSRPIVKNCAALSLGMAYAGSARADIVEHLKPFVEDPSQSIEILGHFALALGLLSVGSADGEIAFPMLTLFDRDVEVLKASPYTRLVSIGLGLLYLGKPEEAEVITQTLSALAGDVGKQASTIVEVFSLCNSGSTDDIQKLLHKCNEHLEENDEFQGIAVLGIAMVAMAEEIGAQMVLRTLDHLLRYGEISVRRAVPLALALLCIGNPTNAVVVDTLSKLSHDADATVAMNAIFALGITGVGTNNSRLAQMFRQLVAYYSRDNQLLYAVRLAQGLLHMGKGTLGINPDNSQGFVTNKPALGAILAVLFTALDMPATLAGSTPYLLYLLSVAIHPRWLFTVDHHLEPKPVSVRVGTAVDVVGQAGKPKTITGFQTHTTPVLLSQSERAEFASDQFLSESHILEGLVIVKPNPAAKPEKLSVQQQAKK
jgi:26S proteasome regulatory subunit N1